MRIYNRLAQPLAKRILRWWGELVFQSKAAIAIVAKDSAMMGIFVGQSNITFLPPKVQSKMTFVPEDTINIGNKNVLITNT